MLDNELQDNYQENGDYQPQPQYSRGQKIAVAVLAVFAFLTISLWFIQFKKTILGVSNDSNTEANTEESNATSNEALKNKDTDKDGLSDYDEINIYNTSAYLADSDSDGILDKAEIEKGTDPNCPVGQTCFSTTEQTASTTATGSNQSTANTTQTTNTSAALSGLTEAETQAFLSGTADVALVKKVFLKTGTTQAELDTVSDSDLMKNYKEQISQINSANSTTNKNSTTNTSNSASQSMLSGQSDAQSLRQMLISSGMKKEMLDKFSDEELMKAYKDILKNQGN